MRCLRAVWSTGFLFLTVFLLSIDSGVFAAPRQVDLGKNPAFLNLAEKNVVEHVGEEVLCYFCKLVVKLVQSVFESSVSEDFIAIVVKDACKTFEIEDDYICTAIVQEFKQEVLYIFAHTALSSDEACGALIGDDCGANVNPFNQTWSVPIPGGKPAVVPVPTPKKDAPKNRILHLTDIHWDPTYTPGLTVNCGEPLCCRPPNKKANTTDDAAPYWGWFTCDPPLWTIEALLQHINKTEEFDWVYWTGDNPSHGDWNQSRADALNAMDTLTALMKKYFPNKRVFSAMGNHDSVPVNSFPPPYITDQSMNDKWLLNEAAKEWSELNRDPTTKTTISYAGYYSTNVTADLKVIAVETNFCYKDNWWLLMNSTDPAHELNWLISELLASEKSGQKVHIIGHIPPYSVDCLPSWSYNYFKIANRFENTITGHFFGHRHEDRFSVMYEEGSNRPFDVVFMAPSVTPFQWLNMGYRIYTIDGSYPNSSRSLIDFDTSYMDLVDAKSTNTTTWKHEYSAKAAYNMSGMSAADWVDLLDRFNKDDSLFQKYYTYYSKSYRFGGGCAGYCKTYLLCDMHTSYSTDTRFCTLTGQELKEHMKYFNKINQHC